MNHRDATNDSDSDSMQLQAAAAAAATSIPGPTIVVGSLRKLDIRGTTVTPSSLVDCFWALTHHNHFGADRSWCKVWFEALYLGGAVSDGEDDDDDNDDNRLPRQHQHPQHFRWTCEDIVRLETVLAMDEMEPKHENRSGVGSNIGGVSYLASKAQP